LVCHGTILCRRAAQFNGERRLAGF
jgi:hypothetical protein